MTSSDRLSAPRRLWMFHVSRPLSCLILTLIVDKNGKRCNSGLAFVELFARYISARLKNLSLSSGSLKGNRNLKNFFCLRLRRSRCDYVTPLDFTRSVSYSLNLVVVRQGSGKKTRCHDIDSCSDYYSRTSGRKDLPR